jgi:hypothetical protein
VGGKAMKMMNGKVLEVELEPAGPREGGLEDIKAALRRWEERRGLKDSYSFARRMIAEIREQQAKKAKSKIEILRRTKRNDELNRELSSDV